MQLWFRMFLLKETGKDTETLGKVKVNKQAVVNRLDEQVSLGRDRERLKELNNNNWSSVPAV